MNSKNNENKKTHKENKKPSPQPNPGTIYGEGDVLNDILGSYTGRPKFGGVPEQDADDL